VVREWLLALVCILLLVESVSLSSVSSLTFVTPRTAAATAAAVFTLLQVCDCLEKGF